jgi:molybdopterin molybdotransferase
MFSVEQAQRTILTTAKPLAVERCPLNEILGQVLAEDVASDIDMPPFDKSLVDGFAVRSIDLPAGTGKLAVIGEITAGMPVWEREAGIDKGQAVRIMTGAPVPNGADAVVMVERTTVQTLGETSIPGSESSKPSTAVSISDPSLRANQNIMRRGAELSCDQTVLRGGVILRPAEIAVLAAVGRTSVLVYSRPRVAIVCTGNELVEVDQPLKSGQIRNSNGPLLCSSVDRLGATADYLGIAQDTAEDLEQHIRDALRSDVLILSGGVSAGALDLVPGALRKLGVSEVFHKVNLKPGKPVWFGVAPQATPGDEGRLGPGSSGDSTKCAHLTLVFGLPGNPVSVMACFELFVAPAIRRMMGYTACGPRVVRAALAEERSSRSDRPTYWPAWFELTSDGATVRLVAWKGSPDLRATTEANCFAIFPEGEQQFRRGQQIEVLLY